MAGVTFQCNQCCAALDLESKHVVLPCLHLYCEQRRLLTVGA